MGDIINGTQAVTEETEEQVAAGESTEAQSSDATEGGEDAAEEPSEGSDGTQSTEGEEGSEKPSSKLWEGVPEEHPLRDHVKSLNAENAAKRVENRNLQTANDELQGKLKDAKTPEEFQAAISEYTSKVDEAKTEALRERVARQHGLPDPLADRLRGTTEEELVADAVALQSLVGPAAPAPTPRNAPSGGLKPADKPVDSAELADQIRNRRW